MNITQNAKQWSKIEFMRFLRGSNFVGTTSAASLKFQQTDVFCTFIIILTSAMLCLSGCGVQKRSSSDVKYFLLAVERPETEPALTDDVCLRVRPCRVASPFASRSLVYRIRSVLYEQDYYNLFLTSPDSQLTDILRDWFRRAGFAACAANNNRVPNSYTLEPRVDVLCADFTDSKNPAAIAQMHIVATKNEDNCACYNSILEKTFTVRTPLSEKPTAAEVVKGMSRSLTQILQEAEKSLLNNM